MKLNCGKTLDEWAEDKYEWHKKFVIFPRKVGREDCRWLEIIERRLVRLHYGYENIWKEWEYRSIK